MIETIHFYYPIMILGVKFHLVLLTKKSVIKSTFGTRRRVS